MCNALYTYNVLGSLKKLKEFSFFDPISIQLEISNRGVGEMVQWLKYLPFKHLEPGINAGWE